MRSSFSATQLRFQCKATGSSSDIDDPFALHWPSMTLSRCASLVAMASLRTQLSTCAMRVECVLGFHQRRMNFSLPSVFLTASLWQRAGAGKAGAAGSTARIVRHRDKMPDSLGQRSIQRSEPEASCDWAGILPATMQLTPRRFGRSLATVYVALVYA